MNVSDEILDFLVEQIPAQSPANGKASEQARQRVWALMAKENAVLEIPPFESPQMAVKVAIVAEAKAVKKKYSTLRHVSCW